MGQTFKVIVTLIMSLGLVACGQGMESNQSSTSEKGSLGFGSDGGSGSTNDDQNTGDGNGSDLGSGDSRDLVPVPFDVRKVTEDAEMQSEQVIAEANVTVKEAEDYLNKIKLGGGRISVTDNGASQQLIIDKAIKRVLDKILEKIKQSPSKFDSLRSKLADQISKLDSANPLHQSAIAALMKAMGKVDTLEDKFGDLMSRLAGGMDVVIGRLDTLVSAVPFPVSIIVAIEWSDVKAVLQDFQRSLQSL